MCSRIGSSRGACARTHKPLRTPLPRRERWGIYTECAYGVMAGHKNAPGVLRLPLHIFGFRKKVPRARDRDDGMTHSQAARDSHLNPLHQNQQPCRRIPNHCHCPANVLPRMVATGGAKQHAFTDYHKCLRGPQFTPRPVSTTLRVPCRHVLPARSTRPAGPPPSPAAPPGTASQRCRPGR
jgi:hypothetical protein